MNHGFTKLFSTIVTSTIWNETNPTRIVWITLLALADREGEVGASVPGLARAANVTIDECRSAIQTFLSPDPDSRTKDFEGRRIEEIDGGWRLINHGKYRDAMRSLDRTEYLRIKQAERRDRMKRSTNVNMSTRVNPAQPIADADADADAESDNIQTPLPPIGGSAVPAPAKFPHQLRAEALWRRRITTPFSASEARAWKVASAVVLDTAEEDWKLLEWWFGLPPGEAHYRKTDFAALLNNWHAEIEKARRNRDAPTETKNWLSA